MNQKGAIHLIIPLLLLIGLIVTVYLVTQGNPLKLFSKASIEDKIEFKNPQKDANGNYATLPTNSNGVPQLQVGIAEEFAGVGNTAPFVWVEVTSINPAQVENTGVGNSVLGVNSPTVVTIKAWGDKRRGIVPSIILADGSKGLFTYSVTASSKQNAQTFTYTFPGNQTFISKPIIKFTNDKIAGDASFDKEDRNVYIDYITVNGVKYETEDAKTYSSGSWSKTNGCGTGYKKQEKLNCNGFFRYDGYTSVTSTPKPTVKPTTTPKPTVTAAPTSIPSSQPTTAPTVAPTPTQVYTTHFQIAESITDLTSAPLIPYTPTTRSFGYTFKDKTKGVKTLFVQFIDSDGKKHPVDPNNNPIPLKNSQIEITYTQNPTPTPTASPIADTFCNIGMFIKFQDITSSGPELKYVKISLKQPGTNNEVLKLDSVPASSKDVYPYSNTKGDMYRVGISGVRIACGTYDLYVSSNGYEEKKYPKQTFDGNLLHYPETYLHYGPLIPVTIPSPTPQASSKRVFVTSTTYNGNLGGLSGADAKCQDRANAANLDGTWKAWLSEENSSDKSKNVAGRLTHASIPYSLLNGDIVANNWTDLTTLKPDGTFLRKPINVTELGTEYSPTVWSNTNYEGSALSSDTTKNCWRWQLTDWNGYVGYGGSNNGFQWTNSGGTVSCSTKSALYCFEQ